MRGADVNVLLQTIASGTDVIAGKAFDYLAARRPILGVVDPNGGDAWLPTDAASMAKVVEWLMVAENEIARGPNDARLHDKFGVPIDAEAAREKAKRIFGLMETHLAKNNWLTLGRPSEDDTSTSARPRLRDDSPGSPVH